MDHRPMRELAAVYAEAAEDPQFQSDNEAIERDFAALDLEAARFASPHD